MLRCRVRSDNITVVMDASKSQRPHVGGDATERVVTAWGDRIVVGRGGLHEQHSQQHEAARSTHMLIQETTGWSEVGAISATMTSLNDDLEGFREHVADDDDEGRPLSFFAGTWPRINVIEATKSVIITAEVPGLTRDDVTLALKANLLTVSGERVFQAPQRYMIHLQERTQAKFSRSVRLPCDVTEDWTMVSVEHGVLTISLPKVPEGDV